MIEGLTAGLIGLTLAGTALHLYGRRVRRPALMLLGALDGLYPPLLLAWASLLPHLEGPGSALPLAVRLLLPPLLPALAAAAWVSLPSRAPAAGRFRPYSARR
ncbi:hypothetical protein HNR42_003533 [Deinobacterium chartae]|uniref:Uncharacterized protein n=1 Tax=Deinobacterium chartae TaxID=521158 RepID=A0A841I6F5_9DEIO|nr:hypothetical protein [Deinobacterium chartae]MBB6100068.1 hypothetical protein [Deinobacterium chartae]